jgi:hypothetical protein
MQAHVPANHQHDFVARIDMKLRAVFAAARHEGERFWPLPQDAHALAAGEKIDDRHGQHGRDP